MRLSMICPMHMSSGVTWEFVGVLTQMFTPRGWAIVNSMKSININHVRLKSPHDILEQAITSE